MASNIFMSLKGIFDQSSDASNGTTALRKFDYSASGESLDSGGPIEIFSYDFSIQQIGSEQGGRPRSVESVERTDCVVTKQVDAHSPKLFRYCCEGYFIGEVDIYVFGITPSPPYITYTMRYVHIARYEPSGKSNLATETIGLRFGQMTVHWNAAGAGSKDQGNQLSGTSEATWSWVIDAPINMPKLPNF
ncbi:MAG: type VI secretion system tube protein Hcp [Pirellulaceae bacterium]